MRSISILVLIVLALSSTWTRDITINQQWKLWKNQFNKSYTNVEERLRRMIWGKNLEIVEEHNRQADLGLHTYRLGMNQFSDLTNEEFVKLFKGFHSKDIRKENQTFVAYSAVGSIEGAYAIKTSKLVSLSEQQLVDCSTKQGNMGCNGGLMTQSFEYLEEAGGIESEDTYPYKGHEETCTFNTSKVVVKVCGFVNISSGNEDALKQAVALIGPIATAVDASRTSFQMYQSGVYEEPQCSSDQPSHGIFIVGYGNESGKDYWLLKNSWGTDWGEQGYIKLIRNKNNECAIATMPSYPIIC
ncbi:unnamed protein product [Adineta steineri]|uniref:Uncharacterized protein n=1 Tax=Adineta steineri TaxID=433720 RepID=A0A815J3Q1_9BILA|nr:unnamed protein product [Adineta steineri]CAF3677690.1 unnamed protein product [Adineta steineri]